MKAAEAQLRMMGISPASLEKEGIRPELPIYTPINGHVRSIDIQIGSYVQEHERLFGWWTTIICTSISWSTKRMCTR